MSVAVPQREVTLSARGERVVFDYRDGLYRVAYYRRKLDPVSKRYVDGEDRYAVKQRSLSLALTVVFGEAGCRHDAVTVEHYIRSTPWGAKLP